MTNTDVPSPQRRQTRSRTGTTRVPTVKATRACRIKATRKVTTSCNTREDSLSRRFPGLLPNLLGPPLSSSPPPAPAPTPAPAPAPTPTPVPPAVAAAAVVVPSSPPRASSPIPGPSYDLDIEYTLRVNRTTKVKDTAVTTRREFVIWDMEDMVENMVRSPASEVEGRDYRVVAIGVAFRAGWRAKMSRSAYKHKTLTDFVESGDALLSDMDRAAETLRGCDFLEMKVDVKIEVTLLQKAFPRTYANEPSSPGQAITPPPVAAAVPRGSRTTQLLRAESQQETRRSMADLLSSIHERWICHEPLCNNFGHWCWVAFTGEHFAIRPSDGETWTNRINEGRESASVEQPPNQLVAFWRSNTGNQLKVHPHTRKGKGKRRPGSTDSSTEEERKRHRKRVEDLRHRRELQRLEDEEEEREEARQQRKYEQERRCRQRQEDEDEQRQLDDLKRRAREVEAR
ncbi:hypothetical protein BU23DRAFT_594525 [Bimuria novae-zelandiae CBS 107.79]|uniref:Uncharacterized protein n=1 Tax=Bimuria novae-zelandiae CBS 107.79 TaxID=1447943 RepID=A0A6A5VR99_9PLEO|nr:hypothetical protein BU23DRAFT_594525 [Bimuria novae-zelandiae CBS 107.79]